MPAGTYSRIYTPWSQNVALSLPQDKVLATKAQASKVAFPTCRGVMRLLTNFASMALLLARIHSHPLQFSLKDNYKTPTNLFKGLKPVSEATQAMHWWCSFKRQPKSIYISVVPKECNNQGSISKGHEKHPIDCLEAQITICTQNGIRREIIRKVTGPWTKEPS